MKYVKLGNSGLDVSRICLGTMSFGSTDWQKWLIDDENVARAIIKKALDSGINFIDTANIYSYGLSEEIVGRALKDFGVRDEVVLATKVYRPMRKGVNSGGLSRKAILHQVDESLRRLQTDFIDLYIIHRWDYDTPIEETLVKGINGILALMEKRNLELTVDCPEGLTVSHDSRWTSEALFNLLDNAVKYTPAGGSIHVSVQNWEMYLKIDVSDTGRGIPEREQAAIFKRFYREEAVHDVNGIGIGLYLAREIITMQGGYIWVTSQVGKGSTFSVFLPHG